MTTNLSKCSKCDHLWTDHEGGWGKCTVYTCECAEYQEPPTPPTGLLTEKPEIVCLCGSGRFKEAFDKVEFDKTLSGEIVLTIGCNTHDIAREVDWQHVKPMLDELHKRKIDLCDYVFVVNVDGYIGDSTRSEIEYATKLGKPVKYLEVV